MKKRMAEIRASCTFQGGNNMTDRMKMAAGNELPMANRQYIARLFEMIFFKEEGTGIEGYNAEYQSWAQ